MARPKTFMSIYQQVLSRTPEVLVIISYNRIYADCKKLATFCDRYLAYFNPSNYLTSVHEYQKNLEAAVLLYKRRMDWLSSGSRSIAGTLAEPTILILVDISASNLNYAIHIQHALRCE